MENTYTPSRISGAFLLLAFCSFAGILASFVYSGYVAIAIGIVVIALALGTRYPDAKRDRTIVFSLAATCVLLGVGAITLGVVARMLAQMMEAG
jgi:NADH:ubiquinone oxidoreductase subunit 6 (subunit J)